MRTLANRPAYETCLYRGLHPCKPCPHRPRSIGLSWFFIYAGLIHLHTLSDRRFYYIFYICPDNVTNGENLTGASLPFPEILTPEMAVLRISKNGASKFLNPNIEKMTFLGFVDTVLLIFCQVILDHNGHKISKNCQWKVVVTHLNNCSIFELWSQYIPYWYVLCRF